MCVKVVFFLQKKVASSFWPSQPVPNECVGSLIWEKGISNFGPNADGSHSFSPNKFILRQKYIHVTCGCDVRWVTLDKIHGIRGLQCNRRGLERNR